MIQQKCELEEIENGILQFLHLSSSTQHFPDQQKREVKGVVKAVAEYGRGCRSITYLLAQVVDRV
jgi:hypothetical protein